MIPEMGEEIKPGSRRRSTPSRHVPFLATDSRGLAAPGEVAVDQTNATAAKKVAGSESRTPAPTARGLLAPGLLLSTTAIRGHVSAPCGPPMIGVIWMHGGFGAGRKAALAWPDLGPKTWRRFDMIKRTAVRVSGGDIAGPLFGGSQLAEPKRAAWPITSGRWSGTKGRTAAGGEEGGGGEHLSRPDPPFGMVELSPDTDTELRDAASGDRIPTRRSWASA